jgi:hypothetical protein
MKPNITIRSIILFLVLTLHAAMAQTFTVNTASREEVRVFYNSVYSASVGVPIGWTGAVNGCNPGTISQAYLDATLLRVNFYRALAGVPTGIVFSNAFNTKVQATALLMSANNNLDHAPPANWTCWTTEAADGAGKANLNLGSAGPDAVDSWMGDAGANNTATGHRRWVTYAPQLVMGSGSVPASTFNNVNFVSASALYVFGPTASPRPATREPFVSWPPKGFIPYPVVFHRWSFSYPGADFTGANVAIQRGGTNVPVLVQSRTENGFGDNTIIWVPNNLDPNTGDAWAKPSADDPWTVTVSNVLTNGTPASFTYTVTIFDPAVAGPDYHPAIVSGPAQPVVNQNNPYSFTAVSNATGYQWRSTKILPLTLTDGAENGLVNFTAVTSGYSPVTNQLHVSGANCFRLGLDTGFGQESLTLNRTLEATATSQITFQSRLEWTTNQDARVEVSTDNGANWTAVFAQQGIAGSEGAFSLKTINLASFAGKPLLVRFNLVYLGGAVFNCCGLLGWYFDDITFNNFFDLVGSTITTVPAGLNFNFTPAEVATFELSVRPQFYNQFFGPFGPSLTVTSVGTNAGAAPNITGQPQPQTVSVGGTANFSVTATGSAPLTYQWRRNSNNLTDGAGIVGSQTSALSLSNVQLTQAGNYDVVVTNTLGRQTSNPALLTVNAATDFNTALNTSNLVWVTSGDANWYVQSTNTHDGVSAAQSGHITDNQVSTLQTTVSGPGTLTFWWQVSSELNFDKFSFSVDGVGQYTNSGLLAWEQKTVVIAAGTHTLTWTYRKDVSLSDGFDAAWLDQVTFTPTANLTLAAALNNSNLVWATSGDANWFPQTTNTHDGVAAAQSGHITDNQASTLQTTVTGPGTLTFWWQVSSELNFDKISFEVDAVGQFTNSGSVAWEQKTVAIAAGTHTLAWIYRKDVSLSSGMDAAWVDQVTFTPTPLLNLATALDNSNLVWATSGDANWYPQTTNSHDGVAAAQSGHITDNQVSTLQTSVSGPGTLTFWWQVSSELDFDKVSFEVDAVGQFTNSGTVAWEQKTVAIAAGTHTLTWTYRKDVSLSAGLDAAWVDQVSFVGGGIVLAGATRLANGAFQFGFSGSSGQSFTVLGSTNLTAPINTWSNLGLALETPSGSGNYQYTDLQATNQPKRFFRVRLP